MAPCVTCPVVLGNVAMLLQDLLHAAECDGCQVAWILQLEKPLQVASCLTSSREKWYKGWGDAQQVRSFISKRNNQNPVPEAHVVGGVLLLFMF